MLDIKIEKEVNYSDYKEVLRDILISVIYKYQIKYKN